MTIATSVTKNAASPYWTSADDIGFLRAAAVAVGLCWSVAFIGLGLFYRLNLYGDGSVFSYAVAVQDSWSIHLHNISGRLSAYLLCFLPGEIIVALTGNPGDGVKVYACLYFAAPFFGLALTLAADRSRNRVIFNYACFSTACLGPLVFGFPTEMWLAHALFWPALAVCHYASRSFVGLLAVFLALLALALTHEGALILVFVAVATTLLHGYRNVIFLRALAVSTFVIAIWVTIKMTLRPDGYIAGVLANAARNFFDFGIFTHGLLAFLAIVLFCYALLYLAFWRKGLEKAHLYSGAMLAVACAAYWFLVDHSIHAEYRYFLRTAIVMAVPVLGVLAAIYALDADEYPKRSAPILNKITTLLSAPFIARAALGALILITLVLTFETAKFINAWEHYTTSVRNLATSALSDLELGDSNFVSSRRIDNALNRVSWSSTTPYLSVMLAPRLMPTRLVVDPGAGYFWLSCQFAIANEGASRAIPAKSRGLIRIHACLHR
jgi:hypothetical protein